MAKIDIAVESTLAEKLNIPACVDMSLPKPTPLKITLPTGGSLNAFTDMSRGVPTDCALTFSLMLQIAPLLANMDCILKILGIIGPLIKIVKGLPFPPPSAISDFIKAAGKLAPCLAMVIAPPASLGPFIRDILCLILNVLRCFISQLKMIKQMVGGLGLQLQAAQAAGNTDLVAALQCSQDNAGQAAASAMSAMEPVFALLSMVSPVMELAQVPAINVSLPALGNPSDVQAIEGVIVSLTGVADAIQIATDALGGCG
ncbi:MAG: hypothetical protein HZB53_06230 [Chloroflexi bacterium]|nr:hypothetical protein [Chloroflexota bacterium]